MDLKPPRRKKHCKLKPNDPFPIVKVDEKIVTFSGRFNGFAVIIDKPEDIQNINSMGFFGKANLSRSFPNFNKQDNPILLRKRQYNRRKLWVEELGLQNIESTIIVNDSDSENEDYINNLQPKLTETFKVIETLNLCLEEAYFLASAIKCLNLYDFNNTPLDLETAWKIFAETQENFVQNYIAYYFFRSNEWVVKPGLKFGGDFLLYKQGPPFYHASYLVIIDVLSSDTLETNSNISTRSMDMKSLVGLNRMTETAAKEVLICQIVWPNDLTLNDATSRPVNLKTFSINTVLMRRWIAKHERSAKDNK